MKLHSKKILTGLAAITLFTSLGLRAEMTSEKDHVHRAEIELKYFKKLKGNKKLKFKRRFPGMRSALKNFNKDFRQDMSTVRHNAKVMHFHCKKEGGWKLNTKNCNQVKDKYRSEKKRIKKAQNIMIQVTKDVSRDPLHLAIQYKKYQVRPGAHDDKSFGEFFAHYVQTAFAIEVNARDSSFHWTDEVATTAEDHLVELGTKLEQAFARRLAKVGIKQDICSHYDLTSSNMDFVEKAMDELAEMKAKQTGLVESFEDVLAHNKESSGHFGFGLTNLKRTIHQGHATRNVDAQSLEKNLENLQNLTFYYKKLLGGYVDGEIRANSLAMGVTDEGTISQYNQEAKEMVLDYRLKVRARAAAFKSLLARYKKIKKNRIHFLKRRKLLKQAEEALQELETIIHSQGL